MSRSAMAFLNCAIRLWPRVRSIFSSLAHPEVHTILRRRKMADHGLIQLRSVFLKMDKLTGSTLARRRHTAAFTGCATQAVSAACLCALALLFTACASPQPIAFNEALRQELIQMRDADQRIRTTALHATNFHGILAVDGRHLLRMKEIVAQHGWPGKSLV